MAAGGSDAADAPYWAHLSEGRLSMQCCQGCGDWKWPAVTRCGLCGTDDPEWKEIPFSGEVFSWTKVWYSFGGTDGIQAPYVTVLAALPQAGNKRIFGLYEGEEARLDFDIALVGHATTTRFGNSDIPSIRWSVA